MTTTVVLVGAPEALAEALRDAGTRLRLLDDPRRAAEAVDGADAVVVSGIDPGLRLAQTIGRIDRTMPVLVLEPADRLGDSIRQIRTAPFVGRNARCIDASRPPEQLASEVLTEAASHVQHDMHVGQLHAISRTHLAGITDQRVASQYLGQLVEHAPVGVATVDPEGSIRGWNPHAAELTGRSLQDALGTRFESLFHRDHRDELLGLLARATSTAETAEGVFTRRGPLGEEQHLELLATSLDDGVGGLGALVLFQDITARLAGEAELAARAREAMLAADIGAAITRPGPLQGKLQRCAEAVVEHLEAAFARIWCLHEDTQTLQLQASAGRYTHLDGAHSTVPVGELKIGRIAAHRRPHLTNDIPNDPEISDRAWAAREGMVAFAGYPLVAGGRLWGVLALFARDELPPETLGALAAVADTVAVGIQQADSEDRIRSLLSAEQAARRAAEDLTDRYASLARTLQQSLLPPTLPEVPGLEAAARYHWAGSGTEIGGDFYDLLVLPDGRWCAVLGDISGKGAEAARSTALIRYTLRTAARTESDLRALAELLNEVMREDVRTDRYCTVVLAAGDARPSSVSLLLAGHPYPALLLPDGSIQEVGVTNFPIGMFAEPGFRESTVELPDGAALVLFSDGVTDARAPTGEFHPGLIAEVLPGLAGKRPAQIAAAVEAAAVAYQGGRPVDDIAVMALRARHGR